jgi:general secretion pathway protein L
MASRLQVLRLTDALASVWRWWRDELLGMLPATARATLLKRLRPSAVDLPDDEVGVANDTDLNVPAEQYSPERGLRAVPVSSRTTTAVSLSRDTAVHLRLPPRDVLRRAIDLPLAAGRNLREILRFEVERLSPVDPADLHWDWRVIDRSRVDNKLRVEVWFVKQRTVARALRFCGARRLSPVSVGIAGECDDVAVTRLLPRGPEPLSRKAHRLIVPALAALTALSAVLLLNTERDRRQSDVDQLRAHVAQAKTAAQAVERLQKDVQQASTRARFLADRKQEPMAIAVLAELTRHLPDASWLNQVEFAGREVRIQGFAPKASALIEVFSQSPLFANPQFRAPVTRGPRGDVERFDLSFEMGGRK